MCAIAGCSTGDGHRPLETMLDAVRHRGPDDSGIYEDAEIALGNRLLAIVDIGHGKQPFVRNFAGETYVGVFNGELYNFRELRAELENDGFRFATQCDTEVVVAAFAKWRSRCVDRFEGQWAFAIWASKARQLFLCRDPLGIKPLFYHSRDGQIAFASEVKSLLTHPRVSAEPDILAIQEYFLHGFAFASGYSLNHRSFFKNVESLPQGHFLEWNPGGAPRLTRYFQLHASDAPLEFEEAVSAVRDALSSSIIASMMGDAPIGVALSGGLDSSIIASVAARENRRLGRQPLLTSSIIYDGQLINEDAEHAVLLEEYLRADAPLRFSYSRMRVDTYLDDLDLMISHFDEPHWEIKQLAMFNNYRNLKSEGAKVVLTGEGADELFFGYFHRFPGFKNPVIDSADELRVLWRTRLPAVEGVFVPSLREQVSHLLDHAIDSIYRPASAAGYDPARCMQQWYLSTFLHWLLLDNDRCSMAFSLEGRFPFLNRRVFELAMRIPPELSVGSDHGEEKLVLRRAFAHLLPEAIARHRKKAPLPSPAKVAYHAKLAAALELAIEDVPGSIWDVLDKRQIQSICSEFQSAVGALAFAQPEAGGEQLTKYLSLAEPWALRSPQIFGILTLLRWWKMHFA